VPFAVTEVARRVWSPSPLATPRALWETPGVDLDELAPKERVWVVENEARWRRAHEISLKYPALEVSDIFHVLCTLRETPTQRVRRSLAHGRLRPKSR
jgi:hypothetical protein